MSFYGFTDTKPGSVGFLSITRLDSKNFKTVGLNVILWFTDKNPTLQDWSVKTLRQ